MPAFVTETLPEDLSVLLFSQSPVLADLLTEQLKQHGLEVTRKSSDVGTLTTFLESGLSSTWYKVFWIDDVTHLSIEQAKKISRIFQEIKGLSYVVMHQPFHYQGYKKFEHIGNLLTEIDTFFAQRSPYTSLLTYQDVLSNELFSLNYQQIVHFLNQGKFPFNQDIFTFCKDTEVMEGIASLSFDPRGGKRRVVISKKPVVKNTLLKAIQTEFRRRFKGEEVFVRNDDKVQFSPEFKGFEIPTSTSQEGLVSELIVEAKFHYKPQTFESGEEVAHGIPKPIIPKAKLSDMEEVVVNRKERSDSKLLSHEEIEFKPAKQIMPVSNISAPEKKMSEKKDATQLLKRDTSDVVKKSEYDEVTHETVENTSEHSKLSPLELPLDKLIPRSLQAPSIHILPSLTHQSLPQIQESSIQIRVTAPIAPISKRSPVMIPDAKMPEIKRSKIILHQLNNNLEKPVHVQKKESDIPYLNTRVIEKIQHERQLEQARQAEAKPEEDHQKKLLEKKIATLFSGTLKPQKVLSLRKPEKKNALQILFGPETKVGKWYRAQKGAFLLSSAVIITTICLVSTFFFSTTWLERQLLSVSESFEQGTVKSSQIRSLVFAQNLVEKQVGVYSSIAGSSIFSGVNTELEMSKKLSVLNQAIEQTQEAQTQAILQILGVLSGDPVTTLNPSLAQADTIYKQLSLLEAELKQTETPSYFQNRLSADQQSGFLETLSEIRRQVLVGQQLTTVLPQVLTKDRKKTVAIVLQDAAELRATGGFVQTIALITFSEGQLSDIRIIEPDEIDSGSGGVITPPEEVTEYLGEKQWFLRDGNWNPNFEISAKQLSSFIEKGTGTPVDVVIGMNSLSLAKLLNVVGAVTVNNENITEKNLADRQIAHARESLTNSPSTNTQDFLSAVLKSWLEKLKTIDPAHAHSLAETVSEQLKQKELTIFSSDLAVQSTLGALGWTGSIILPPCPTQLVQDQCVVSTVFQTDSNVGVNKVNYSVNKKVEQDIQIAKEKITHKRTITYENSSTSNSWPGGSYKNYIRWYFPPQSKLLAITVDGKAVPATQIKQYQDRNFQVIGALISVLPQTTATVSIEYQEEAIGQQASFVFFDQKQPGTGNTPTKVTMFYDQEYLPSVIAPTAEITDEKIEFSLLGEEHSFVGVKFR